MSNYRRIESAIERYLRSIGWYMDRDGSTGDLYAWRKLNKDACVPRHLNVTELAKSLDDDI